MRTLYHGTTPEDAEALLRDGWTPGMRPAGANQGQSRFLYLTTGYEDALWFSGQKGSDAVVALADVPLDSLAVDPEDGVADSVTEEMDSPHGLPGKLVLTKPLAAGHFSLAAKPGPSL